VRHLPSARATPLPFFLLAIAAMLLSGVFESRMMHSTSPQALADALHWDNAPRAVLVLSIACIARFPFRRRQALADSGRLQFPVAGRGARLRGQHLSQVPSQGGLEARA